MMKKRAKKKVPFRLFCSDVQEEVAARTEEGCGLSREDWMDLLMCISFPHGVCGRSITEIPNIVSEAERLYRAVNGLQVTPWDLYENDEEDKGREDKGREKSSIETSEEDDWLEKG